MGKTKDETTKDIFERKMKLIDVLVQEDAIIVTKTSFWNGTRKKKKMATSSSAVYLLALKMKQLSSLKALETLTKDHRTIIALDASLNRIRSMEGIQFLEQIQYIDLSLNQLNSTLLNASFFTPLVDLRTLKVHCNHIQVQKKIYRYQNIKQFIIH